MVFVRLLLLPLMASHLLLFRGATNEGKVFKIVIVFDLIINYEKEYMNSFIYTSYEPLMCRIIN